MRMATVADPYVGLDVQIEQLIVEARYSEDPEHMVAARAQLRAFIVANFIPVRKVKEDGKE
jgi:hypothetical protein